LKNIVTVAELYQYLDDLFDQDIDNDTLFAGGYLRGFIALSATDFGDEQQLISMALIDSISNKLVQAKAELSPRDHRIVKSFWFEIQDRFYTK